jgi:hypothetical protein
MAFSTIDKGASYFNTVLWTGNGGTQTITGVGFQPSLVWGKSRSVNYEQSWIDFIRGGTKYLFSNGTSAESTDANAISSFNSDGFSIGTSPYIGNANGATYVGWNWLASNSTVSNTQGTVTSTVSANTTAGFSIVSFTTISGGNATIGHGLGSVPKMIIMKARTTTYNWDIYHVSIGNANRLLFTSAGSAGTPCWGSTTPTSSVFTMDQSFYGSGIPTIAYCFAEIRGYSKFASYTGNGSADGPFIYTGFKPAFLIIKQTNADGENWYMWDNKRDTYNVANKRLFPNLNNAEETGTLLFDFLSNGFKLRSTYTGFNQSGGTFIYAAFAENPFVLTDGTPVTAR